MSKRNYEHLGHTELASMCHHRDAKIDALEAENARLKAQVEAADVLAGAGVALHERLRHVLNVLEGKETRILPGPDIVEARRVLQQSHFEHMHALDAYRATATEES